MIPQYYLNKTSLEKDIEELKNTRDNLLREVADTETKIKNSKKASFDLETSIGLQLQKTNELNIEKSSLLIEILELEKEKREKQKIYAEEKARQERYLQELEKQKEQTTKEINLLSLQKSLCQNQLQKEKETLAQLKKEKESLSESLQLLQKTKKSTQEERNKAEKEYKEFLLLTENARISLERKSKKLQKVEKDLRIYAHRLQKVADKLYKETGRKITIELLWQEHSD